MPHASPSIILLASLTLPDKYLHHKSILFSPDPHVYIIILYERTYSYTVLEHSIHIAGASLENVIAGVLSCTALEHLITLLVHY